jgi:hypothetical protein
MRPRLSTRRAAALTALACALAVTGCSIEADAPSAPDLERVESTWGIEAPDDLVVRSYDSSEHDFQGGADEVYVVDVPDAGRSGPWDPSSYSDGIADADRQLVDEIIGSSQAGIDADALEALRCAEPRTQDQDFLLICHSAETDEHVLFQQLF